MKQFCNYLVVAQRPVLPEVGGDQRQGVEYSLGCIALNRADNNHCLVFWKRWRVGIL